MLMTEASAWSPLLGWLLYFHLLWPLDYEEMGGAGEMWGNPGLQEVEREKNQNKKKNLYLIAPNFERIGWAGELLK